MSAPKSSRRPLPVYQKLDAEKLRTLAEDYDDLIATLSAVPSKKQTGPSETLAALDEFRYKVLPDRIASRWNKATLNKCYTVKTASEITQEVNEGAGWITLDELKQLMEWKLRRGKNRPALRGLIASNLDREVKLLSKAAIAQHQNRKNRTASLVAGFEVGALDELKCLRGVGDATASLVLSAAFPADFPFFSDELYTWAVAMENKSQEEFKQEQAKSAHARDTRGLMRNMPSIKYTHKEYSALCDSVLRLQDRLGSSAASSGSLHISAADIDKAAFVIMRADEISPGFEWAHDEAQLPGEQAADEVEEEARKKRKRPTAPQKGESSTSTTKEKKRKDSAPTARRETPRRAAKEKA